MELNENKFWCGLYEEVNAQLERLSEAEGSFDEKIMDVMEAVVNKVVPAGDFFAIEGRESPRPQEAYGAIYPFLIGAMMGNFLAWRGVLFTRRANDAN